MIPLTLENVGDVYTVRKIGGKERIIDIVSAVHQNQPVQAVVEK